MCVGCAFVPRFRLALGFSFLLSSTYYRAHESPFIWYETASRVGNKEMDGLLLLFVLVLFILMFVFSLCVCVFYYFSNVIRVIRYAIPIIAQIIVCLCVHVCVCFCCCRDMFSSFYLSYRILFYPILPFVGFFIFLFLSPLSPSASLLVYIHSYPGWFLVGGGLAGGEE